MHLEKDKGVPMETLNNDEGMWLPDGLPVGRLQKMYGFRPAREWVLHAQRASVKMNNGGSASFVSPNGLLATNHHVAESVLQELSSEGNDYVKNGFYAKTRDEEIKALELEVNVLWEIEDVTKRVQKASSDIMSPAESFKAQREEIARIEDESHKRTGLRSNVITLYRGGKYHLYRFKQYTDVRLVFAPEYAIAGFGGDFDNYEYPRFNLDVVFFRVYEDGKPLTTPHFFRWESRNPQKGALTFASGHPGITDRLSTLARILHLRDHGLPYQLNLLRRKEILLQQYAGRSLENARKAHHDLRRVQNVRKRFLGQLQALQDPAFLGRKREQETSLQASVNQDERMSREYGDAWRMVEKAEKKLLTIRDEINLWEGGLAFDTKFFEIARAILRLAAEDEKPNHERLHEFVDSSRDSFLQQLFSPAPIYRDMEEYTLADSLALLIETLGSNDSLVAEVLGDKSPQARAHELIAGTKLDDVEERKRLVGGGEAAIRERSDTFLKLAALVDVRARKVREFFENEVEEARKRAYAKIAKAMFEIYGEDLYPDATSTLRVAFGRVLGYQSGGECVSEYTTIAGTFPHAEKHGNKDPWELPESWKRNRAELEGSDRAFNFISTHDTHGGNSGSPIFTPDLKIIGLLFDGTVEGLGDTFIYTDTTSRSVSVHTAGILEALKKIYRTERLVRELTE